MSSNKAQRLAAELPERYAFRSEIGRGAAAFVVLADDVENNIQVAVKILRPEVATIVGEKRFRREVEILSQLDHPNILRLLDHGTLANRSLFLVTPYIVGETLRQRLKREKQLSLADTVAIARDVASALDYAHDRGLIHRDIKPANILLSETRVIVADFGISRWTSVERYAQITISGVSLGTPEYMSPEQIGAVGELDARSDVYALGCVVYEMLSGKPPFTGVTSMIFMRHRKELPRPLAETRSGIPAAVEAAVMKSLAKLPGARFKSAGDFAGALVAAAGNQPRSEAAAPSSSASTTTGPAPA
jgi:serine/threonine-protein kinase